MRKSQGHRARVAVNSEPPPGRRRTRHFFGRVERRLSVGAAIGLFLLAAAFHLVLAAMMQGVLGMSWANGSLPGGEGFMEVVLVPPEPEDPENPEDEEDEEQDEKDRRLVENHAVLNEDRPTEADKVSEFDHTVDQEQRAPLGQPVPATSPSKRGDSPDADEAKRPGESDPNRSDTEHDATSDKGKGSSLADSLLEAEEDGDISDKEGGSTDAGRPGIRGNSNDLAQTFGRRGSLDYMDDVEQGDVNLLNTKRTKYASFFNRVRNAVSQHWHPEVVHAARDPEGKVYGSKTRTTRLRIILDPSGAVVRIWVDRPSGVDYLDEEAIRSVRAAAPFTNPPRQLADPETGEVDFAFNFILMIDGSKRIFRYRR